MLNDLITLLHAYQNFCLPHCYLSVKGRKAFVVRLCICPRPPRSSRSCLQPLLPCLTTTGKTFRAIMSVLRVLLESLVVLHLDRLYVRLLYCCLCCCMFCCGNYKYSVFSLSPQLPSDTGSFLFVVVSSVILMSTREPPCFVSHRSCWKLTWCAHESSVVLSVLGHIAAICLSAFTQPTGPNLRKDGCLNSQTKNDLMP